jgi:hypothetical protein
MPNHPSWKDHRRPTPTLVPRFSQRSLRAHRHRRRACTESSHRHQPPPSFAAIPWWANQDPCVATMPDVKTLSSLVNQSTGNGLLRWATTVGRACHLCRSSRRESSIPALTGTIRLSDTPSRVLSWAVDPSADGSHLMRVRGLVGWPLWTRSMDCGPIPPNFL